MLKGINFLSGSNADHAGSGGIKLASSLVIQAIRPATPLGAQCMEHAEIVWSVVCSAPHS